MTLVSRKAVALVALLVTVATVSYAILCLSPVDPIRAYLGDDVTQLSLEQRHKVELRWGAHQSPIGRYVRWLRQLAHGDLGRSLIYDRPVVAVIAEKSALS